MSPNGVQSMTFASSKILGVQIDPTKNKMFFQPSRSNLMFVLRQKRKLPWAIETKKEQGKRRFRANV